MTVVEYRLAVNPKSGEGLPPVALLAPLYESVAIADLAGLLDQNRITQASESGSQIGKRRRLHIDDARYPPSLPIPPAVRND